MPCPSGESTFTCWFTAPLVGDNSVGTAGISVMVVKLRAAEYTPVPPLFFAFTRQ